MQTGFKKNRMNILALPLVLLVVFISNTTASAWWDGHWTLRKKITVDASSEGTMIKDDIGTSAVLVRLHDGNYQFLAAKEDGSDIRFVAADDKTVLKHHVEKYDALLNEAFVWVKVPDIKAGEKTEIWMYYGNTGGKATAVDDVKGTYDADTVLVYHFSENGAPAQDVTGTGNNAETAGARVEGALIGSGVRFDGQTPMTIPASSTLGWDEGVAMTWTAWVKPAALQENAPVFSRVDGSNVFVIGLNNGVPYVEITSASGTQRTAAGEAVAPNAWTHLAVVAESGKISLYRNGESYATLGVALPLLKGGSVLGGKAGDDSKGGGFVGEIDELNISKAARSPGFIKLTAIGQGTQADRLIVPGQDEQNSGLFGGGGGHFAVIIESLTFDGWVVIVILAGMSILSWWVMVTKVSTLNAMSKANGHFMEQWKHVASDLTVLDHEDSEMVKTLGGRMDKSGQKLMRNASIFRIYHTGVEEIRDRIAANAQKVLSALSMQAIRASMDGTLVRETQKLNRQIVFLTLSISGGPFLGLLGTVVGVMITFAAVAEAGEVNVNAIAPGIAAALLATVAGLAVAIPALFGYNYLLSRIKDAVSDMHVFIDEFVTKAAEYYSNEGGGKSGAANSSRIAPKLPLGFENAPIEKVQNRHSDSQDGVTAVH